jgi:hypothetical protein
MTAGGAPRSSMSLGPLLLLAQEVGGTFSPRFWPGALTANSLLSARLELTFKSTSPVYGLLAGALIISRPAFRPAEPRIPQTH